ncbi:MAG: PRC-barrel domain-containing protein [Hyphomicrobium sp.]
MNKFAIPAVAAFALMAGSAAAAEQQQQGAGQQAPQAGQHELVGMGVVDKDNEEIGEVENVLINSKGQVQAVILDRETGVLGGLGGDGSVAIPFDRLQLPEARPGTPSDEQNAKIDMTEEELGELPEFESTYEETEDASQTGQEPAKGTESMQPGQTGTHPGQQR